MTKSQTQKIVIIEDEIILLKALNIELLTAGFEVYSASEGKEGLDIINKVHPDLVLLDLILPGVSGFDVAQEIRKNPKTKKIPIIVLSNLGQEDDKKKALKIGADDYFVKSSTHLEVVTKKINNLLSKPAKKKK